MPLVNVGQKAPSFELTDQRGKVHRLSDLAGRNVVVYFYPKDDTSDCTLQACQFRDAEPDFGKVKATVLGVSPDDASSHERFAGKHDLTFPLLVDERDAKGSPRTCGAYGVWQEKSMYGRKYMGVVRTTYLIGPDGRVAQRWDKVKVKGHAAEVLAAVKALQSGAVVEAKPAAARVKSRKPAKSKVGTTKRTRSHDSDPPYSPVRSRAASVVPKPKTGKSSGASRR